VQRPARDGVAAAAVPVMGLEALQIVAPGERAEETSDVLLEAIDVQSQVDEP
jgi:hypothetical protein